MPFKFLKGKPLRPNSSYHFKRALCKVSSYNHL
ncbi:hypothetical protein N403_05865 [Helicobacter pylori FD430]|uniref:Uncharacterized protein n=1 Tax=Helicobacter pylori UM114 TaxID=1355531 RepID=T0F235_HELPX|nr:hypothetical protein N207_04635 [Helicobacter pylori UM114]EPZ94412.1 hypothetical protein N202_01385 [Helicobacter pylori UM067]EQL50304.1 hypothetical protein N403_05865 [Helicobacter pylori FD430]